MTPFVDVVGVLGTLAAAALLTGKLRKVDDISRLSVDTQYIGAIMVGTIGGAIGINAAEEAQITNN